MKLLNARVKQFRSIDDSTEVEIDPEITCLVGKNESGKTNFIRALYLLKPFEDEQLDVDLDFPKKDWADYKARRDKEPATAVTAKFGLDNDDLTLFIDEFGPDVLIKSEFVASRDYSNEVSVHPHIDERAAVRNFLAKVKLDSETARIEAKKLGATLAETVSMMSKHADPAVKAIGPLLTKRFSPSVMESVVDWLWKRTPTFVYFGEYQLMPGTASIPILARKGPKELSVGETTLLRLIARASLTLAELNDQKSFERHIANLEGAAAAITRQVFKYWTQNQNLVVRFMTSAGDNSDPQLREGPLLRIRIENLKHSVTVPFGERSKGFVWFFSFLAYFNEIRKNSDPNLIILLDEPGLSLHATAQADLLRFVEEQLASTCQTIYTTHSPFMIDAQALSRVRTVQDMDAAGTLVTSNVWRNDAATLFPLQAALGFKITQTLFIGPNSLLVEGPSEVLYLPIVSEQLSRAGKVPLDPRWTLTPIQGIDKAQAFVSLFGAQKLKIAVLMDYAKEQKKLVESLRETISPENVVALHEFRSGQDCDIEDLFDVEEYLAIVNEAYRSQLRKPINPADLTATNSRIVKRLEHHFEAQHVNAGKFGHATVAEFYARNLKDLPLLRPATLERFRRIFERLNSLLPAMKATAPETALLALSQN